MRLVFSPDAARMRRRSRLFLADNFGAAPGVRLAAGDSALTATGGGELGAAELEGIGDGPRWRERELCLEPGPSTRVTGSAGREARGGGAPWNPGSRLAGFTRDRHVSAS